MISDRLGAEIRHVRDRQSLSVRCFVIDVAVAGFDAADSATAGDTRAVIYMQGFTTALASRQNAMVSFSVAH